MDWPQPPRPGLRPTLATVTAPAVCGVSVRHRDLRDERRLRGSLALPLPAIATWSVRRRKKCRTRSAVARRSEGVKLLEQIRDTLRKHDQPLPLSVLGSALEWTSEQRVVHGRLASFLRRQPELWLSGGFVGEAKMRDWQRPKSPKSLRALEFFSGIGGLRAAFHRACTLAGQSMDPSAMSEWVNIESSPLANEVYSSNFHVPYEPLLPKDIRRVEQAEVEGADLWLMSPPCQPYTRMGLQRDLEDRRAKPLLHLTELVPKLQKPPQAILLENVVGFETSGSFQVLSQALCGAGMEVHQFSLSPLQLGIPNRRPRIYVLACQSEHPIVHPLKTEFPGRSLDTAPNRQLVEYLHAEDIDAESTCVPERLLELLWDQGQRWEVVTGQSTSSSTFTSGYTTACYEAHRFGPLLARDSEGLTGSLGEDARPRVLPGGRIQRLVEPGEDLRYFTTVELLRLHGFSEHFQFPEGVTQHQRYKLIGDSISVDVVAELQLP